MPRFVHCMIFPPRMCFWVFWLFVIKAPFAFGQVDTLELGAVEVSAVSFSRGASGVHLDRYTDTSVPFAPGQGVAEWLGSRTNNVLMGYGPGGSFGLSLRGGSSAQTQIMVNGIPFEHPGLSQADISLLPAVLFTDAAVYRGSSGALLGNASVGGTLFLDARAGGDAPLFAQDFIFGSFGQRTSAARSSYHKKKLHGRTVLYWQESQNNFDRSDPGNPMEMSPQPNAFFRTRGLQQNLAFQGGGPTRIDASMWYNLTNREIPPSLSQERSAASQEDENLRIQASVQSMLGRFSIHAKTAFDHGKIRFRDTIADIDDPSRYNTFHAEALATWSNGPWEWSGMAIFRNSQVFTAQYTGTRERTSPALIAKGQRHYGKHGSRISAAVRAEWLNGRLLPALPTLGLTHMISPQLAFRASAGRVFRLPGLNDLYWNPGGNPNLRPESGWSEELGIDLTSQKGKPKWNFSGTIFNRNVDDWIVWLPVSGIWEPQNLRKVWSRGLEISGSYAQKIGSIELNHHIESTAVRSTQLAAEGVPAIVEGKQLAYIPVWSNFFSEGISWSNWFMIGSVRHQSVRYTNTDNSGHLDAFITGDVELAYERRFQKWRFGASLAIRNITDNTFQLQANRPMPGRHYSVGVNFSIH